MNKIRHLAIIMDGNGRWAKAKNKKPLLWSFKRIRKFKNISLKKSLT